MLYKRSVLKNFSEFTDKHKKQSSGGDLPKEKMLLKILQNSQKNIFARIPFGKVAGWKLETFRSSHWRCSVKKGVLKNFANVTGKNLCWSLFLIKLQFWRPAILLKKTPTQVVSCEICKLFKNNYLKRDFNVGVFLWILWIIQEHLFCRGSTNGWFWSISARVCLQ